jgi:hypothetical protein
MLKSLIVFFGNIGTNSDTVLYYFDNNKEKTNIISCDESGKYSLLIKSNKPKTITFYFKGYHDCPQTLNLIKIRKQIKNLKTNKIQIDIALIRDFACVRIECEIPRDVYDKYSGEWIDRNKLTLKIDCYYKREFIEDGLKFSEEGTWSGNGKQIVLESVYIENIETGTYMEIKRNLIFNYENGQLKPVDKGTEYNKKN